jgi:hypothetical protein
MADNLQRSGNFGFAGVRRLYATLHDGDADAMRQRRRMGRRSYAIGLLTFKTPWRPSNNGRRHRRRRIASSQSAHAIGDCFLPGVREWWRGLAMSQLTRYRVEYDRE